MEKFLKVCKDVTKWVTHRINHKIEHYSFKELKSMLVEGGLPLLVIFIAWEVIEDVLFPLLFGILGKKVNPAFYTLIPVSWLMCLHWAVVPIVWGIWMKVKKTKVETKR